MSKYRDLVIKALSGEEMKSTNELLKEVEKASGKSINWHMLYRVLMELHTEGKIDKIETKAGFFWKRRSKLN